MRRFASLVARTSVTFTRCSDRVVRWCVSEAVLPKAGAAHIVNTVFCSPTEEGGEGPVAEAWEGCPEPEIVNSQTVIRFLSTNRRDARVRRLSKVRKRMTARLWRFLNRLSAIPLDQWMTVDVATEILQSCVFFDISPLQHIVGANCVQHLEVRLADSSTPLVVIAQVCSALHSVQIPARNGDKHFSSLSLFPLLAQRLRMVELNTPVHGDDVFPLAISTCLACLQKCTVGLDEEGVASAVTSFHAHGANGRTLTVLLEILTASSLTRDQLMVAAQMLSNEAPLRLFSVYDTARTSVDESIVFEGACCNFLAKLLSFRTGSYRTHATKSYHVAGLLNVVARFVVAASRPEQQPNTSLLSVGLMRGNVNFSLTHKTIENIVAEGQTILRYFSAGELCITVAAIGRIISAIPVFHQSASKSPSLTESSSAGRRFSKRANPTSMHISAKSAVDAENSVAKSPTRLDAQQKEHVDGGGIIASPSEVVSIPSEAQWKSLYFDSMDEEDIQESEMGLVSAVEDIVRSDFFVVCAGKTRAALDSESLVKSPDVFTSSEMVLLLTGLSSLGSTPLDLLRLAYQMALQSTVDRQHQRQLLLLLTQGTNLLNCNELPPSKAVFEIVAKFILPQTSEQLTPDWISSLPLLLYRLCLCPNFRQKNVPLDEIDRLIAICIPSMNSDEAALVLVAMIRFFEGSVDETIRGSECSQLLTTLRHVLTLALGAVNETWRSVAIAVIAHAQLSQSLAVGSSFLVQILRTCEGFSEVVIQAYQQRIQLLATELLHRISCKELATLLLQHRDEMLRNAIAIHARGCAVLEKRVKEAAGINHWCAPHILLLAHPNPLPQLLSVVIGSCQSSIRSLHQLAALCSLVQRSAPELLAAHHDDSTQQTIAKLFFSIVTRKFEQLFRRTGDAHSLQLLLTAVGAHEHIVASMIPTLERDSKDVFAYVKGRDSSSFHRSSVSVESLCTLGETIQAAQGSNLRKRVLASLLPLAKVTARNAGSIDESLRLLLLYGKNCPDCVADVGKSFAQLDTDCSVDVPTMRAALEFFRSGRQPRAVKYVRSLFVESMSKWALPSTIITLLDVPVTEREGYVWYASRKTLFLSVRRSVLDWCLNPDLDLPTELHSYAREHWVLALKFQFQIPARSRQSIEKRQERGEGTTSNVGGPKLPRVCPSQRQLAFDEEASIVHLIKDSLSGIALWDALAGGGLLGQFLEKLEKILGSVEFSLLLFDLIAFWDSSHQRPLRGTKLLLIDMIDECDDGRHSYVTSAEHPAISDALAKIESEMLRAPALSNCKPICGRVVVAFLNHDPSLARISSVERLLACRAAQYQSLPLQSIDVGPVTDMIAIFDWALDVLQRTGSQQWSEASLSAVFPGVESEVINALVRSASVDSAMLQERAKNCIRHLASIMYYDATSPLAFRQPGSTRFFSVLTAAGTCHVLESLALVMEEPQVGDVHLLPLVEILIQHLDEIIPSASGSDVEALTQFCTRESGKAPRSIAMVKRKLLSKIPLLLANDLDNFSMDQAATVLTALVGQKLVTESALRSIIKLTENSITVAQLAFDETGKELSPHNQCPPIAVPSHLADRWVPKVPSRTSKDWWDLEKCLALWKSLLPSAQKLDFTEADI